MVPDTCKVCKHSRCLTNRESASVDSLVKDFSKSVRDCSKFDRLIQSRLSVPFMCKK